MTVETHLVREDDLSWRSRGVFESHLCWHLEPVDLEPARSQVGVVPVGGHGQQAHSRCWRE